MSKQESLDRYVRRVLKEKGLSYAEVEARSEGAISDSYIGNIVTGSVGSVTVAKLKALARGLDVSEDEIFAIARGQSPADLRDFQKSRFVAIFDKYKRLHADDQKEMLILLEAVEHEIERRQLRHDLEKRYSKEPLVA
ncbi:MAG: helix-turn-helix domain-containing protein [Pyrinomonadaceae bacterium]|nr:helix-turn-helix domain-containing protein [Pyrinomonadaceae bacterium]